MPNYFGAGRAHFFNRLLAIVRIEVNGAHGVRQSFHLKAFATRVEDRVFHAVVSGESANPNFCDAFFAQQPREVRAIESRVTISAFICSF